MTYQVTLEDGRQLAIFKNMLHRGWYRLYGSTWAAMGGCQRWQSRVVDAPGIRFDCLLPLSKSLGKLISPPPPVHMDGPGWLNSKMARTTDQTANSHNAYFLQPGCPQRNKGDLKSGMRKGMVVSLWNQWEEAQGGEVVATVAGTKAEISIVI